MQFNLFAAARGNVCRRDIRVVGQHLHSEQALAEFGQTAADIADADDADSLILYFVADQRVAIYIRLAAQHAIGLENTLRQRQHHAERVFRHRMRIAAGLIDDHHARRRAGIDVDRIKARAIAGDDQQVRRSPQQIAVDMEMSGEFVARRTDLIGMCRGQDGCRDFIGTFILEPVEPNVGPRLQNLGVDRVRQIFDVEHALVVDGHFRETFLPRHGRARPGHPRLWFCTAYKTWMPGTRPGMTTGVSVGKSIEFCRIGDEDALLRHGVRRPFLKQLEQMADIGHRALDARMRPVAAPYQPFRIGRYQRLMKRPRIRIIRRVLADAMGARQFCPAPALTERAQQALETVRLGARARVAPSHVIDHHGQTESLSEPGWCPANP